MPPRVVFEIPADCAFQSLFHRHAGAPAQFAANARGVDGVSRVMAGPIGDEGDQNGVCAGLAWAQIRTMKLAWQMLERAGSEGLVRF